MRKDSEALPPVRPALTPRKESGPLLWTLRAPSITEALPARFFQPPGRSSGAKAFFLAGEFDRHLFVGVGPAPDRDGLVALQDHMVGEGRVEAQFGGGGEGAEGEDGQGEQGDARDGHAYLTAPEGGSCEQSPPEAHFSVRM